VATTIKLGVIPGDGIGPEVTKHAVRALELAAPNVTFIQTEYDFGAKRYNATGEALTEADLEDLAKEDVLLLGAIGDPSVPSGILERGFLLKLRFGFDHFVNLRPTKLLPGVVSPLANPGVIDFVVVREGTEGLYLGQGEVTIRAHLKKPQPSTQSIPPQGSSELFATALNWLLLALAGS
jgi:3-isopropylmalate dehydrogenase